MTITTKKFQRKPFAVEAVQVTAENMSEVSTWCHGELRKSVGKGGKRQQSYISVNVKRPLTPRQTQAYVGDWVVTASDQTIRGFKVYTPQAFDLSFDEVVNDMVDVLERMDNRAKEEEQAEQEGLFPEDLRFSDPALR